jgi:hypothetical protein
VVAGFQVSISGRFWVSTDVGREDRVADAREAVDPAAEIHGLDGDQNPHLRRDLNHAPLHTARPSITRSDTDIGGPCTRKTRPSGPRNSSIHVAPFDGGSHGSSTNVGTGKAGIV